MKKFIARLVLPVCIKVLKWDRKLSKKPLKHAFDIAKFEVALDHARR